MARRWTSEEEGKKRKELVSLYIQQNKTIKEVGRILDIAESSVFDRMLRLGISSIPEKKVNYRNIRHDIILPQSFSKKLAEFVGIMLGDGHLSPTQVIVSSALNELPYVLYILKLAKELFGVEGRYIKREKEGAYELYIGSTVLVRYFHAMGLVSNKVRDQVDTPKWIFKNSEYQQGFVRGFFDTDGSLYKLRFGYQMNFCNNSQPLLLSAQKTLNNLQYHPSRVSGNKFYLTRIPDLQRYAKEIGFGNLKNLEKARRFGIIGGV